MTREERTLTTLTSRHRAFRDVVRAAAGGAVIVAAHAEPWMRDVVEDEHRSDLRLLERPLLCPPRTVYVVDAKLAATLD